MNYLYLISRIDSSGQPVPPVKIGVSGNPKRRIETIQTACPFAISLIDYFPLRNARKHEKELHDLFLEQHSFGEWFNLPPKTVSHFIRYGIERGMDKR